MRSTRKVFRELGKQDTTHAGLWLDKYLPEQTEGGEADTPKVKEAKANHLASVTSHPIPHGYREALSLRRQSFEDESAYATVVTASTVGPLAVGLGTGGAMETGLRLERTWGVPIIPGSALKGVAASAARKLLDDDDWKRTGRDAPTPPEPTSSDVLFGTTERSGAVTFHDAWWVPDDAEHHLPIHSDVMTTHHPNYYQKPEVPPPTDFDDPNPVSFASVRGRFLVVVEGPEEWREAALAILKIGLDDLGVGAKNSSGYGRLDLDYVSEEERNIRAEEEARQQAEDERKRVQALQGELPMDIGAVEPANANDKVPELLEKYEAKPDLQRELARELVSKLKRKWLTTGKRANREWCQRIVQLADEG